MFSLFIAVLALVMVVVICITTAYYAMPDQLDNIVYGVIIWLGLTIMTCFIGYKRIKKKYIKSVEEKQKAIKMLNEGEIKNYIVDSVLKDEMYAESIAEILTVLKVSKKRKEELEAEIVKQYYEILTRRNNMTEQDILNLVKESINKV